GGVEGVAAVPGEVGHGAENGDGDVAGGVARGGRIKGPVAGALDGLVGHAGDERRGVILGCYLLAAVGGVAAGIGCPPGAGGIEGVAAVTGEVGDGAEDGDGHVATGVTGGRRIEGPVAGALDDFVSHASDGGRCVIFQRHLLAAVGRVAAGIRGSPGACDVESVP